jgi:hypothetical protein
LDKRLKLRNHNVRNANRSFENVVQFKYLGTTVTKQNLIQNKIKRGLYFGKACYNSGQNLLFSHLLSKTARIRIYKNVILLVVPHGCETWSLTLREEAFRNRVLRRTSAPKRK